MALRLNVEGPLVRPPEVSLVEVVRALGLLVVQEDGPLRWGNGIEYENEACSFIEGTYDICDQNPDVDPGASNVNDLVKFDPWGIWEADVCSVMDVGRNREERAQRALEVSQSYQIARELWKGTFAQAKDKESRWLASEESDVVSAGGTSLTDGIACLEQGLAQCGRGRLGMIHVTPQVLTYMQGEGLVSEPRQSDGLARTVMGTIIVSDAGYDGSSPLGAAPASGSIWAYATSLVRVWMGPLEIFIGQRAQRINTELNDEAVVAHRVVMYDWDECCHLAVELNLDPCGIGGS